MKILDSDFIVVGSGLAGLMSALHLARHGTVLVLTKKAVADSNTAWAQGGIACVMDPGDSFDQHVSDTLDAGAGLCDESVVREIIGGGPEQIRQLEAYGLKFAELEGSPSGYDLGKEGGHSKRRVLHCGDLTGHEIEQTLLRQVADHENITLMEHCAAIDLITTGWIESRGTGAANGTPIIPSRSAASENQCVGLYAYDGARGEIFAARAPHTVLATGGGGKVYIYTSNPDVATADGVAIAWRAGLPIKNLEFIQFHPTTLYHHEAKNFLISEAVRGENALLVNANGDTFTRKFDDRGSLAPRDIVARAIDSEMKSTGAPCVFLDARHMTKDFLEKRFPKIYTTCLQYGIDMTSDLIPVVPSAHYFCGGIETGVDGATAMPGLHACGEVACTGLHGANRLASNSLLEALVCSRRTADRLAGDSSHSVCREIKVPAWHYGDAVPSDEGIVVEHNWNEVRTCMWDYVGIVRTNKRLERARRRLDNLRAEIRDYYLDYFVTPDILELRNIADVAALIVRSAQSRHESRGLQYTLDYPDQNDEAFARPTVIEDTPAGAQ